jgi:hypothetical protein
MGIGEVLLHAISAPPKTGIEMDDNLTRPLRQIFPVTGGMLWPPGIIMDDADCHRLARALDYFSDALPFVTPLSGG